MRAQIALTVLFSYAACLRVFSQPNLHQIKAISANGSGEAMLELSGFAPSQFGAYFDIYTLERSIDLHSWNRLGLLLRTNSSPVPLKVFDSSGLESCFYRTFTNHNVTPFNLPTGQHAVGAASFLITDASRTNRYNVRTNSSFMGTLWYPSVPATGSLPSPYVEARAAGSFAGLYGIDSTLLAALFSAAYLGPQVDTSEAPYPVILYSHGFRVGRRDNTARCLELASHGYVVVAVDHSDALATVFPDGRLLTSSISSLSLALFTNNVQDLRTVLDELARMNSSGSPFHGILDLTRVGTFGWSYGGGVAAEICRTDERVKATVLLDAYLQNAHDVAWLGIQKPFLGLYNETSAFTTPFDMATGDAYWMRIRNTEHQHFADWLAWISSPTFSGRHASLAMNACMVSFFDKWLKNQDDHFLDNPAAVFPEILGFARK